MQFNEKPLFVLGERMFPHTFLICSGTVKCKDGFSLQSPDDMLNYILKK